MKDFLSIEKFKEIKILFFLEIIQSLLIYMLVKMHKLDIEYWWNTYAFIISISIFIFASIIDKEKYWNLATLIGLTYFIYVLFCIIFIVLPM